HRLRDEQPDGRGREGNRHETHHADEAEADAGESHCGRLSVQRAIESVCWTEGSAGRFLCPGVTHRWSTAIYRRELNLACTAADGSQPRPASLEVLKRRAATQGRRVRPAAEGESRTPRSDCGHTPQRLHGSADDVPVSDDDGEQTVWMDVRPG